ncbi:hypothetical protein J4P91_06825 [Bacillus sp. XF8]|nr:hypothetical protein [Bacillus sp. XF8]
MVGFTPNNLRSLAKRRGDLEFTHERDTTGKINADYQEVLNEESRKVHAKIDKDFEEFLKAFNKYFGEGN